MTSPNGETSTAFVTLNDCAYLFLRDLREQDQADGQLRLIIDEVVSQTITMAEREKIEADPDLARLLCSARAIASTELCRRFELVWSFYIGYQVLNESYALPDETASGAGGLFKIWNKSAYLHYIRSASFADDDFPAPLRHYRICCQDQVIDVISTEAPKFSVLNIPSPA